MQPAGYNVVQKMYRVDTVPPVPTNAERKTLRFEPIRKTVRRLFRRAVSKTAGFFARCLKSKIQRLDGDRTSVNESRRAPIIDIMPAPLEMHSEGANVDATTPWRAGWTKRELITNPETGEPFAPPQPDLDEDEEADLLEKLLVVEKLVPKLTMNGETPTEAIELMLLLDRYLIPADLPVRISWHNVFSSKTHAPLFGEISFHFLDEFSHRVATKLLDMVKCGDALEVAKQHGYISYWKQTGPFDYHQVV